MPDDSAAVPMYVSGRIGRRPATTSLRLTPRRHFAKIHSRTCFVKSRTNPYAGETAAASERLTVCISHISHCCFFRLLCMMPVMSLIAELCVSRSAACGLEIHSKSSEQPVETHLNPLCRLFQQSGFPMAFLTSCFRRYVINS